MSASTPVQARLEALLVDAPPSMSVQQVAETLAVSQHVVRRLLSQGELAGVKPGREWRILRTDLLVYLEGRSNWAGKE